MAIHINQYHDDGTDFREDGILNILLPHLDLLIITEVGRLQPVQNALSRKQTILVFSLFLSHDRMFCSLAIYYKEIFIKNVTDYRIVGYFIQFPYKNLQIHRICSPVWKVSFRFLDFDLQISAGLFRTSAPVVIEKS